MKQKIILSIAICFAFGVNNCHAVSGGDGGKFPGGGGSNTEIPITCPPYTYCPTGDDNCRLLGDVGDSDKMSCGYTDTSYTDAVCIVGAKECMELLPQGTGNTCDSLIKITLYRAEEDNCQPMDLGYGSCDACTACSSEGDWSIGNTGYEYRTTSTCDCGTCNSTTEYRCAKGYYGTPTNGTSGCTRCPSSGGVYGTTASSGATAITDCYIPSGTSMTDTSGTYQFTQNCYYTN